MSQESNWKQVEGRYGADVARFLKRLNVKLEVIGTGFYRIPNSRILDECAKLSITVREKITNLPVAKKRRIEFPTESAISPNCYSLPGSVRRIVNIDEKKWEPPGPAVAPRRSPSVSANMTICLDVLCKRRCVPEGWIFAETKKRHVRWDHGKMFERMMKTSVGRKKAIDHAACLNKIKPVLQTFEEQHKRFKYYTYLKIMLRKNDEENPHVSLKQIQTYFCKVFASVIPSAMFGKKSNVEKLRKALRQYFLASWEETICLKPYVFAMDISSIAWLGPISDEQTKWLIIAKMVKWLFEVFFVAILKSVFRVQKDLYSRKKNFLCPVRWKKCKSRYSRTRDVRESAVKKRSDPNFPENNPVPSGLARLYPKTRGVRSICILRFDKSPESEVAMLKTLLQQLYHRKYGVETLKTFHRTWLKYIRKKKANPDYKVYLVSADIADAYGSVKQSKLYKILCSMINEIPGDKLPLEQLAVLIPNNGWNRKGIEYRYWFSFDTTFPRIKSHALVTLASGSKCTKRWIPKEHILSLLRAYILQQTVWYEGTEYILKKGLVQGSPLSPILSDIYYAQMRKEQLGGFTRFGTVSRFVDDFLYITANEESAKGFIVKINRKIRKYTCRFNPSKTQTNVVSEYSELSKFMTYLGNRIDCTSLAIAPAYGDLPFRHFKTMHGIPYRNEIKTFVMRIRNFSALKLTSIVLDTRINSSAVILSTASSAAHTMALRCVTLLLRIFDRFEIHVADIWEAIRAAVKMVTRMFFRRLRRYEGEERLAFVRGIKLSMWRAFFRVFAKQTKLRHFFGDDMRSMIVHQTVF